MKLLFPSNTKKKSLIFVFITTLFLTSITVNAPAETNDYPSLTFDYIYDSLKPFGTWYDIDAHGWVWRPNGMNDSWQPYTLGHWQLTEEGWLWESNFDWGWLPFHYGKWYWHNRIGWCWVADYEWAPAWVAWYWTDNYVGWAPIPPVPQGESYEIDPNDWFFVSYDNFLSYYLINYRINYSIISIEVREPYVIVNDYYFRDGCFYYYNNCRKKWVGPPCLIVEKNVKRRVPKKKIVTVKKKNPRKKGGKKKVIEIYRPVKRTPIKKIDDSKKFNKDNIKRATIPKSKEKNKRIDKSPVQRRIKPNPRTLPITPIKPKPRTNQPTPITPPTHMPNPAPGTRTIRQVPVQPRTQPMPLQNQNIGNPTFNNR